MIASALADPTPLVVLNVVLGLACLGAVVAVLVAVWLDLRERRRWRAMVPDCWPPPGVDLDDDVPAGVPADAGSKHPVEHRDHR